VVFLVASFTFLLLQVAPGDPVDAMAAAGRLSQEVAEQQRANFGLDRPIAERYARYIWNVAHGDLGHSYSHPTLSVWTTIRQRIPATVLLALTALLIDFSVGILIGAYQGSRPHSSADNGLSLLTLVLFSIPVFWLGLMLVMVFSLGLELFPTGGLRTVWKYPHISLLGAIWDHAWHLFLPALTLGLIGASATARFQRAAMMDAAGQDFVRTARAKGLRERSVLLRHALRNALLPIVTLFGLSFPVLLSGAVLVEEVFSWPGLGNLAVDAFRARDYPLVTGMAIVVAIMVVLGNLVADALYRVVDPRTRPET
jgi:peptide/nickel transport system permease protein